MLWLYLLSSAASWTESNRYGSRHSQISGTQPQKTQAEVIEFDLFGHILGAGRLIATCIVNQTSCYNAASLTGSAKHGEIA